MIFATYIEVIYLFFEDERKTMEHTENISNYKQMGITNKWKVMYEFKHGNV